MAYRLEKDEPVRKGLRRVMRRQLSAAADELTAAPPADEAVRDARKRIKKTRAVLQLVRQDARRDRKRLRRSARLLAGQRDASAMVETARCVCANDPGQLVEEACAIVRDRLAENKKRVRQRASRQTAAREAARLLRSVGRSAGAMRLHHPKAALAAGVRRSYKRARRDMRRARDRRNPTDFHEWRKRLKALGYQLRLLEERFPGARRQAARLSRIAKQLGKEHDLHLLRQRLTRGPETIAPQPTMIRLLALVERRQAALRRNTLRAGARVFADRPRTFVRRLNGR